MNYLRTALLSIVLAPLVILTTASPAQASDYPSRPIELVDPYPPGGSTDTVARHLQKAIGNKLGEPIVVVAKPGAAGNIGAAYVGRSGDPHRLLMATREIMAINPHIFKETGFDPFEDFVPISLVSTTSLVIAVRSDAGIDSLNQIVERARGNPEEVSYGSLGVGSSHHLTVEALSNLTDVKMQAIHYNGLAPAIVALMGGHIDFVVSSYASLKPHLEGGRIKIIAIANNERLANVPDVPTIAEAYPEFNVNTNSWFGIFANKSIPEDGAKRLEDAFKEAIAEESVQEAMRSLALTPGDGTAQSLAQALRQDYEALGKQVTEMGIAQQ